MSGLFKSRSNTTTLEPMLTPEQQQAMSSLLQFGQTGQVGNFQAGQAADLSGFNFNLTGPESQGLNALNSLISQGSVNGIDTARKNLTNLSNPNLDFTDPSSPFAAFSRQVSRATQNASDVLNRDAAITGNRFGTQIGKQKTDLAAQQSDILTSELGRLFEGAQNRSLQASQGLGQLAAVEDQINQSRIAQAFNLGSIQRDLQNQQAQLKYNDFIRARDERLNSIGGLNTVFGRNVDYGLKSLTTEQPSVFQSILGEFSPIVGSYNTHKYGYTTNQSSLSELIDLALKASQTGATGGFSGLGSIGRGV